MVAATGYAPPDKTAQVAGDYLSSSKPSYGIGSSSTNYPDPTPKTTSTATPSATPAAQPTSGAPATSVPANSQISQFRQAYDTALKSVPPNVQAQLDQLAQKAAQWDARNPGGVGPQGMGNPFEAQRQALLDPYLPKNYQQITDALANNMLAVDKNGNFYDPNKPTGFDAFMEEAVPIALAIAGAAVGGELLGAISTGAGGVGTLATTAADTLPVTADSLAYSTGQLTASTVLPGVADTAVAGAEAGAGTLADITVTAGAGGAGAGLGTAASIAGSALALPSAYTGGVDMTGASGSTMPKPNYPQGWQQYTPKNWISNQLQQQGLSKVPANILGGAGQGSLISAITGGDPLKGAIGGGVGTGVGEAISASGIGGGISNAVGGGATGDILSKTATGGIAGGVTSGLLGGNPLIGAASGAVGGGTSAALTGAGLDPAASGIIGSTLGKAATMPTSPSSNSNPLSGVGSAIMGGLSDLPVSDVLTTGAGLYSVNKADKANQALVNTLSGGAQPFITAGQDALKGYQNLSPLEQQQLNASVTAGTSAQQGAQPLIGLGEQQLNIAGSGNLPPELETQLQQQIQAAKAQLAQQYSPDSSTYQQLAAKIDQQGLATRQQMLSQYQTSGQSTYTAGEAQLQAGQQEVASAYAAAQTEIDQNLKNALSMATTGLGPLANAVEMGLLNNANTQAQMQDLMKSIAGASVAGNKGVQQSAGGLLKSIWNSVTGSGTYANTYAPTQSSTYDPYANYGTPGAYGVTAVPGYDPSTNTYTDPTANVSGSTYDWMSSWSPTDTSSTGP